MEQLRKEGSNKESKGKYGKMDYGEGKLKGNIKHIV